MLKVFILCLIVAMQAFVYVRSRDRWVMCCALVTAIWSASNIVNSFLG